MDITVYTKNDETRIVRTAAQRVAAEFDGFKPAKASQPEAPAATGPAALHSIVFDESATTPLPRGPVGSFA